MHPAHGLVCRTDNAVFLVESPAPAKDFVLEMGDHHRAVVEMYQSCPSVHGALIAFVYSVYLIEYIRTLPLPRANIQDVTAKTHDTL